MKDVIHNYILLHRFKKLILVDNLSLLRIAQLVQKSNVLNDSFERKKKAIKFWGKKRRRKRWLEIA